MAKIWVVWKVEDWESYSLVSAHRTKEAAMEAALKCYEYAPKYTATDSVGKWIAHMGDGDCVMVQELPLEKLVKP